MNPTGKSTVFNSSFILELTSSCVSANVTSAPGSACLTVLLNSSHLVSSWLVASSVLDVTGVTSDAIPDGRLMRIYAIPATIRASATIEPTVIPSIFRAFIYSLLMMFSLIHNRILTFYSAKCKGLLFISMNCSEFFSAVFYQLTNTVTI